MRMINVLFEDKYLIVVNKPAGMPSQATLDPNRDHCYAAVRRYLEKNAAGDEKNKVYVGLHHRLDALTSGVILMTKDESANASISEQFQTHTIEKTYCAICTCGLDVPPKYRTPGSAWLIDNPIGELPGGRVQKFGVNGKKRKMAKTQVTCEAAFELRDGVCGVYRCQPLTGRTHQIRVHLASIGLPIIGDPLYGQPLPRSLRTIAPKRLCLHAEKLTVQHPSTREYVEISAPRPQEFENLIRKLKKLGR
jgi:RluA family pseudouridine synthase